MVLGASQKRTMHAPGANRQPLAGQHFQVAVVGGGTTSRSTRILSGLRPLERGDIAFARETLREKEQLLRERPHLAHPSHFLMALSEKGSRSAMSARTALWLYRRMTNS